MLNPTSANVFGGDLSPQMLNCSYEPVNYKFHCSVPQKNQSANVFKTLRINVHFVLRSDGTANFSERRDINGALSSNNGNWFADKIEEICNSQLTNEAMTQQLSYAPIPIHPINYGYRLLGVFFHRNTSLFNNPSVPSVAICENYSEVINIFIFPNNQGNGAASGQRCWIGGAVETYSNYLLHGDWGFHRIARLINHEVGHCLSLAHSKRYPGGLCCIDDKPACLDNCDDTPTYLELLNDGYSDPCIWSGPGYSNNIMDYSSRIVAFTPCQIAQVHSYIEGAIPYYQCGMYLNSSLSINSFSVNRAYIARNVSIPSGVTISLPVGNKLVVESNSFTINGVLDVPLGSSFEVIVSCN